MEPDREEDSRVRSDLRGGRGPARHQRGPADRHAAAHAAVARRVARREPRDRRLRAGRVRDRQGALRPDHRRVRAPGGSHRVGGRRADHRCAGGRAPQSRHRLLQDRHAGRGDARVPPRRRAALGGGERPLLHRSRGPEAGALARANGRAAAGGGEGRQPARAVPQPRLRLRAAGPARRSRGRVRRGGHARPHGREGAPGVGRRGAEAGRLRGRRGPTRSRAGAVRQGAAARVVLGAHALRRGGGGVRARRAAGRGGRGGVSVARRPAEQPGGAQGAGRGPRRGRGRGARGAQERALAPPAVQEPRRPGVSRVALRRGLGGVPARGGAGARPGRRRVLQARQHRVQAERARPRGPDVASGARDQSEARARQGQSGHVERVVVTAGQDERAFRALTQKITRARGLACDSYKDRCLRRRIAVRMRARGVHTFDDYSRLLDQAQRESDLLLDALTINVTKFFRNVETWRALAPWLDRLWEARRGEVRVWSAGCASGEEPYTVAVALAEAARRLGQEQLLTRAPGDATDIDRASLERTRAAQYPDTAVSEMPPELVARYFTAPPRQPAPELRRIVRVAKHDLTSQPAPAPPYDLVVCRNVVIYFDRAMQERLFTLFADALAPGGVLLLGKVETLFGPARERLVLEEPRERIYRRAGA